MNIDIVFTAEKENSGKAYSVKMAKIPNIGEQVLFDFIEENNTHIDLYKQLDKLNQSMFTVSSVSHHCAIDILSDTSATIFLDS